MNFNELTELEKEVLIGTVIGDGCLFKATPNSQYRMNLAHSLKQKEYFMKKYEILKRVVSCQPKERTWTDKRTNNEYSEIRFQTRVDPLFTDLSSIWYEDKKIIPYDELMNFGETTLAVKYFDDGWFKQSCTFSMCDYTLQDIDAFRAWLKDKFNIETTMHKRKNVYVLSKSREEFINLVKPFATSDVLYKLGGPV